MKESAENYLESIYVLSKKKPHVRSIDIVNLLEFSKPSVSVAMKKLKEDSYIKIDNDGFITLTEKGMEKATGIYERHTILTRTFEYLGVSEEMAKEDACKIEHYISEETFIAIKNFILDK
ncbi:MAG: metal-dependent transcriptional regulator [Clostridia bacterium]